MSSSLHIFIFFLAFTVSTIKSAEILTIQSSTLDNDATMGVSVSNKELHEVANNVLMAETWLRNNVLGYYPSSNITHIVVAHNLLCSSLNFHHNLILHALNNLHYSLTRWGLQFEIKVSPSFSSSCLSSNSRLEPLLNFLNSTHSTYLINTHYEISPKFESLVDTHVKFIKKIGFLSFGDIKLVKKNEIQTIIMPSTTMRKLSSAEGPLPPLIGLGPTTSPPPHMGQSPHPHHHHHNLPPCNPWGGPVTPTVSAPPSQHIRAGPTPSPGREKLWCVAKPSVPAETLQEGMDYACGEGGAECEEIQPSGSCYYPDTVVAHASYAFNSYWQKNKENAASCSFGGTAMIINSDPSFLQCRFTVT